MSNDMDMVLTFLGTSAGLPTARRNVSSIALELRRHGEIWLFDCGEATQQQIFRSDLISLSKIRRIFITHMHGDHVFGLPGLLSTLGKQIGDKVIDVYGPPELPGYLDAVYTATSARRELKLQFHTVAEGLVCAASGFKVTAGPLTHSLPAFGYRVEESERLGKFDADKAKADGIPPGPIYKELQQGLDVTLPDGRQILSCDYVGPKMPGRVLVYCTDTTYSEGAIALAQNADVLIHEATYGEELDDKAVEYLHSTATMAAKVAAAAEVKTLILTHFSARYDQGKQDAGVVMVDEAKATFANTLAAHDLWQYVLEYQLA